jgi:cytochrome c553
MKRIVFAWALVAFVLIGIPAFAECRHLFKQQVVHHAVVQPIVHQNIFYSVGEGLVQQVKIEQEVQRQLKLALQAPQQQQTAQPTGTVLQAKCARCHSGEAAKGGVRFDDGVDDAEFRRSVEILSGFNVPQAMKGIVGALQPADKGNITEEMLKSQPGKPAPPADPLEPEGVLR